MNPDSENFEQLRRLLALKRHEQPPPGYFNNFSGEVIARIKTGDQGDPVMEGWIHRLWAMLEAKPIFAGAFGAAVCAVLVSGILNSEGSGQGAGIIPVAVQNESPFAPAAPATVALNISDAGSPAGATNPATPLSALFEVYPTLSAQPVSSPSGVLGGDNK